jgi:hypothetical protein
MPNKTRGNTGASPDSGIRKLQGWGSRCTDFPCECMGRVGVHPRRLAHLLIPNIALWSSFASNSRNRHHTGMQSSGGTLNHWGDRSGHSGKGNRCYMRSQDPPALILKLLECEGTCCCAEKRHENSGASPEIRFTQQKGGGIRDIRYPQVSGQGEWPIAGWKHHPRDCSRLSPGISWETLQGHQSTVGAWLLL